MTHRVIAVLPAYNEAASLRELLPKFRDLFRGSNLRGTIVLVDDGSVDGTAATAASFAGEGLEIVVEQHAVNMGLGATIRDGITKALSLASDDDVLVAMDADNSHPPSLIPMMLAKIDAGADVVIASRYQPGADVVGLSPWRRHLSNGAGLLMRTLFPFPGVRDYTCGFRAYRAAPLRAAIEAAPGTFFDQEGFQCMFDILVKLGRRGLKFDEVPLVLRYDEKKGASKMRVGRTIRRSLQLIVKHLIHR